jgi:hypothetical protein
MWVDNLKRLVVR